jgi:arsenite methyltransferase
MSIRSLAERALDAGFGHPRGIAGRLGGALMVRGNAEQERWAVRHGGVAPGERVLMIGPGPGIGLELAASAVTADGRVVGVDPSADMRAMAARRCAAQLASGLVELREGTADRTGCADGSMDVAISVNNVMLWDRAAGFAELFRVLRPDGRLVITVHRHVLGMPPEEIGRDAVAAGFADVDLDVRPRRRNSPAVDLLARRP